MSSGPDVTRAIVNLDAWLQTMRQSGGYGGPVPHWWQSQYLYTGPGLDWRYEGILWGYAELYRKRGDERWKARVETAAGDLATGQTQPGAYEGSCFEMNPGVLGTPHEAAASCGLLAARDLLDGPERWVQIAGKNLNNLVSRLRSHRTDGFDDRPGVWGRVPNKLATLGASLISLYGATNEKSFLDLAVKALDDVLRYQVRGGPFHGAVHQYASRPGAGDGRFFPYYNARCVPGLLSGYEATGNVRYRQAADRVLEFVDRTMHDDGGWPQVIYETGHVCVWPRWVAGTGDILLAYLFGRGEAPAQPLKRLLSRQLSSGAFPTAEGFSQRFRQGEKRRIGRQVHRSSDPEFRDITAAVGWNDKVLRLLARIVEEGAAMPPPDVTAASNDVLIGNRRARLRDDDAEMSIVSQDGRILYRWRKQEPWATVNDPAVLAC